jgi:hypothetical protein
MGSFSLGATEAEDEQGEEAGAHAGSMEPPRLYRECGSGGALRRPRLAIATERSA